MAEDQERNRALAAPNGYHASGEEDPASSGNIVSPDTGGKRESPRSATLLPILIILVLSFAVYFNALSNGFVYDDNYQILKNQWIKDSKYIPEIFLKNAWSFEARKEFSVSNYYRPIMHLIYMAIYHVCGLRAWAFHLVNIIFHAGVSVLVFLIALRLFGGFQSLSSRWYLSAPFFAAVLFATHPIHTEAVTWIAGLPEVSFAFFFLLSLYLYIRFREGSGIAYMLSIASFFISTLCKETGVTLPFIIVGYDYFFGNTKGRLSFYLKRYIPYLIVTGFYLVLRFNALEGFAPVRHHTELNMYRSIINFFPLFTHYIALLLFPLHLNAYHVFHPISSLLGIKGILSLAVTAAFVALALTALKKNGVVSFSLLFIVVPLLPAFYITLIRGVAFAERYLYLSSFGFVVLLALIITQARVKFPRGNSVIAFLLIALLGLYSVQTITRNRDWKDDFILFTDTVKKSPDGDVPHHQLGIAYAHMGRIDEAISEFKTVLRIDPERAESHNSLGIAYLGLGRTNEAVNEFKAALKLRPDYTEPHYTLGIIYMRLGRVDEAIAEYKAALQLNPRYTQVHNNLGVAYLGAGRMEEAINEYKEALKLNTEYVEAHNNLGNAYTRLGRMEEAINEYKTALRLAPDNAEIRHNLDTAVERLKRADKVINRSDTASWLASDKAEKHYKMGAAYARLGHLEAAINEYEAGLKLNANNVEAHYNLGTAYARLGRLEEATDQYKAALKLSPDNAEAHHNLGSTYARLGRLQEAADQYKAALKIIPASGDTHYDLGIAYAHLGRTDDAINEYRAALKLGPDRAEVHNNLGLAYARLTRINEAADEFKAALRLDPNNVKAHYNLAVAYTRLNRLNEASVELETVLKLDPDNAGARKNYELLNRMMKK